ncbi:MAG: Glu/Leu/Phe/Val dehydrogenase dimerization domain-containing protein [Acidimicrobiales bacterium]
MSSTTVPRVWTTELEGTSELVPGTGAPLGETLLLCHDRPTGLSAVIAVDDSTLGPGLGGVRWMPYHSFNAAVEEACRLSRVMTLKNALADIPTAGRSR